MLFRSIIWPGFFLLYFEIKLIFVINFVFLELQLVHAEFEFSFSSDI